MSYRLLSLWLGLAIVLGTAQGGEGVKKDQEAVQGKWKLVDQVAKGEKLPKAAFDKLEAVMIIQGNNSLMKSKTTEGALEERKATFKLYPDKSPKEVDKHVTVGTKEVISPGIYELKGDTLKVCFPAKVVEGATRPTSFDSTASNGYVVMTFQRVK